MNLPGIDVSAGRRSPRRIAPTFHSRLSTTSTIFALSFVRSPDDVRDLRKLIDGAGSQARVIAKIEKAEAVHALVPIVEAADVVMVARGDLGVEIGPAAVPLLQKRMILLALERGRAVITATQMLESMLHAPEPTRAEASDVANAVLDGTTALMLSEETASANTPSRRWRRWTSSRARSSQVRATATSCRVRATSRQSARRSRTRRANRRGAARGSARRSHLHRRGRRRGGEAAPPTAVVAITHDERVARRLALEWGVVPLLIEVCENVEQLWRRSLEPRGRQGSSSGGSGRDHGRHAREHPGLDECHQGRLRRVGKRGEGRATRRANRTVWEEPTSADGPSDKAVAPGSWRWPRSPSSAFSTTGR